MCHQFLKAVGVVSLRTGHPLKGLVVLFVVREDVGHIVHVVHQLVCHNVLHLFDEIQVGLFRLTLTDQNFAFQIDGFHRIDCLDLLSIFPRSLKVIGYKSLPCLEKQGTYGLGIVFQRQIDGNLGLLGETVILIIVGNIGQVVSIDIDGMLRLDRLLVLVQDRTEFFAVEICEIV